MAVSSPSGPGFSRAPPARPRPLPTTTTPPNQRRIAGYLGYTFPGSDNQGDFPCPPSFSPNGDGGAAWFCMLKAGYRGFTGFPPGATALCNDVATQGVIGYSWPAA